MKSGAHSADAVLPTAVISARVASSHTGAPGPNSGSCVQETVLRLAGELWKMVSARKPGQTELDQTVSPRRRRTLGERTVRRGGAARYKRPPGRSSCPSPRPHPVLARRQLSRASARPRAASGSPPRLQLREAAEPRTCSGRYTVPGVRGGAPPRTALRSSLL